MQGSPRSTFPAGLDQATGGRAPVLPWIFPPAGIPLGVAKYGVRRPDVRAMLHLSEERAGLGFRFLGKLTTNWDAGLDLELGLELEDGRRVEFCLRYEAATPQIEGADEDTVSSALAVAGSLLFFHSI